MTNNTPYAMLSVNNIMDNYYLLLLIPAQNFNKSFINSVKQFQNLRRLGEKQEFSLKLLTKHPHSES